MVHNTGPFWPIRFVNNWDTAVYCRCKSKKFFLGCLRSSPRRQAAPIRSSHRHMPQVQRAMHLALPMQLRQVASHCPGHLQGLAPGQAPLPLHENRSQQRLPRMQG